MADSSLYDTTVPTAGTVALAHQKILRLKRGGVFENIAGDINNLLVTRTPVTVQREVYGTKGVQSMDIIGYNVVTTFSAEGVRDANGQIAQPWLVDLVRAAAQIGAANKMDFQDFDALDESLPAFEGTYSVSYVPGNTGYADKALFNFTLTSDGVVDEITSPIAGTGIPIVESALPAGAAPGDQIAIRGYKFTGTTGVTIDAIAVAEFIVVDDNTLVIVVPATVSGSAPIVVTNAIGVSASFAYTAA